MYIVLTEQIRPDTTQGIAKMAMSCLSLCFIARLSSCHLLTSLRTRVLKNTHTHTPLRLSSLSFMPLLFQIAHNRILQFAARTIGPATITNNPRAYAPVETPSPSVPAVTIPTSTATATETAPRPSSADAMWDASFAKPESTRAIMRAGMFRIWIPH